VGVLSFVRGIVQPPPAEVPMLVVGTSYGCLFGIFPVNALHNLVHIITGLIGIVGSRGSRSGQLYSRSVAIIFQRADDHGPGARTQYDAGVVSHCSAPTSCYTPSRRSRQAISAGSQETRGWRADALFRPAADGGIYAQ